VDELASSGGQRFDRARIDPRLVVCLQAIRDRVGKPVIVTSGYRPYGYNVDIYRKRNQKPTRSRHSSGQAADIKVAGMTGLTLAKAAIDACGCDLGVGIGDNYAHIDVRGQWANWTYLRDARASSRALQEINAYHRSRCAGGGGAPVTPSIPSAVDVQTQPAPASGLRRRIVDIANREWVRWGKGMKRETDPEMRGVLRGYWMTVRNQRGAEEAIDKRDPWSAAFISWAMKQAGAGQAFQYAEAHRIYIAAAKGSRQRGDASKFWAYDITEAKPEVGDLVCRDRMIRPGTCHGTTYANVDNRAIKWATHSDIVTEVGAGHITVIGGNVWGKGCKRGEGCTVNAKTVRIDGNGFVIPEQGVCRYFAIIKVR
jgi:hypothetical protein